MKSKSREKVLD